MTCAVFRPLGLPSSFLIPSTIHPQRTTTTQEIATCNPTSKPALLLLTLTDPPVPPPASTTAASCFAIRHAGINVLSNQIATAEITAVTRWPGLKTGT